MNAPIERKHVSLGTEEQERIAVLAKFRVEDIQHMGRGQQERAGADGSDAARALGSPPHPIDEYRI